MTRLSEVRDPLSLSMFIQRAAMWDKRIKKSHTWGFYNTNHVAYAWVTSGFRFIAISLKKPVVPLAKDEMLVPIKLPWKGNGQETALLIANYVAAHSTPRTAPKYATYKCGRLRTTADVGFYNSCY